MVDFAQTYLALLLFELVGFKRTLPAGLGVKHLKTVLAESESVEFKSSFEWNTRNGQISGHHRLACMKSVAGFLNGAGGTLYIGINDAGIPIGIEDELSQINDENPKDIFEGKILEAIKNHLDPLPIGKVNIRFSIESGVLLCIIDVKYSPETTYLISKDPSSGQVLEEIYVRFGARTLNLKGKDRDTFVIRRAQQN